MQKSDLEVGGILDWINPTTLSLLPPQFLFAPLQFIGQKENSYVVKIFKGGEGALQSYVYAYANKQ